MDVYSLISSPDVAAYCKEIKHEFNAMEIAVLAEKAEIPLKEKHDIWRNLINEYPDMPVAGSSNFKAVDSLHKHLKKMIALEEKEAEEFRAEHPGQFYCVDVVFFSSGDKENHPSDIYSSIDDLIKDFHACYPGEYDRAIPESIYVHKRSLYSPGNKTWLGTAGFTFNGDIICVHAPDAMWQNRMRCKFIHIPVPFKFGDIVTTRKSGKPFILRDTPHWDESYIKDLTSGDCDSYWFKHCDSDDMTASDYSIEDNTLKYSYGTLCEDLMYYTGKLEGGNCFLKYMNWFLKQKSSNPLYDNRNFADLLAAFTKYILDGKHKKADESLIRHLNDFEEDELLPTAIDYAIFSGEITTADLQTFFDIDYSRASRIIKQMEDRGVIEEPDGSSPRKVLISNEYRKIEKPVLTKQKPLDESCYKKLNSGLNLKHFRLFENSTYGVTALLEDIPMSIELRFAKNGDYHINVMKTYGDGFLSDNDEKAVLEWLSEHIKEIKDVAQVWAKSKMK